MSWCRDPVSGTRNELSIKVFVDDVAKQHISPNSGTIQGMVTKCIEKLHKTLGEHGHKQDKDKEVLIVG